MVKKRFYWKTVFKNISQSKGRFFSIFMIIFLGAAVFSGLRNTPYTMAASADAYLNSHNYADLTYIATLGFSDEDIAKVRKLKGVKKVVPCYQFDALFAQGIPVGEIYTCLGLPDKGDHGIDKAADALLDFVKNGKK